MELPRGYYGQLKDRSSIATRGLMVCAGVIDNDYRGSLKVVFFNTRNISQRLEKGERIVQLVVLPHIQPVLRLSEHPPSVTERGHGGFGHSDNLLANFAPRELAQLEAELQSLDRALGAAEEAQFEAELSALEHQQSY